LRGSEGREYTPPLTLCTIVHNMGPMPRWKSMLEYVTRDRRVPPEVLNIRLKRRSARSKTVKYAGVYCLEFNGSRDGGGYGKAYNGLGQEGTHRISWKIHKGPIPEGHDVLHHCDNPACWEPLHLWTGTHRENMLDKMRKGRSGNEKRRGRKGPLLGVRGERHPASVLTEEQAREIKSAKDTGMKGTYVARKYGVSRSLVYGIWSGDNWGWLT